MAGPTLGQVLQSQADANVNGDPTDFTLFGYGAKANKNYVARVMQNGKLIAKGYLPESLTLGVSAEWSEPFAQAGGGAVTDAIQMLTNRRMVNQAQTIQVWQGTTPVKFSLRFHFVANSDPDAEVVGPIMALMRLVLPTKANGLLKPPGPDLEFLAGTGAAISDSFATVKSAITGGAGPTTTPGQDVKNVIDGAKGKISLFIGSFLSFDNVVLENVDAEFDTMFDRNGRPISAKVDVSFKTFMILTQSPPTTDSAGNSNVSDDDLMKLFNYVASTATAG
jgi:hypothetical protein